MQCYKCNRKPITSNLCMVPVDPRGPGRRWVCTECATAQEINNIPKDVVSLCKDINPDFIPAKAGE